MHSGDKLLGLEATRFLKYYTKMNEGQGDYFK